MIAAGLDPSLASTGLCVLDTDTRQAEVWTIKTKAGDGSNTDMLRRFDTIAREVYQRTIDVDVLAIEGRAFSRIGNEGQHQLSGLWWHLWRTVVPDLEVNPSALKKFATGSGNADKDLVLTNVIRRFPQVDVKSNDEADATVLAFLMARVAGSPAEDLPKAHLEALNKIEKVTPTP